MFEYSLVHYQKFLKMLEKHRGIRHQTEVLPFIFCETQVITLGLKLHRSPYFVLLKRFHKQFYANFSYVKVDLQENNEELHKYQ